MNEDSKTLVDRDDLLETFAAELTLVAYRGALRNRTRGTWLDLELDLWRALADTVKTCVARASFLRPPPLIRRY